MRSIWKADLSIAKQFSFLGIGFLETGLIWKMSEELFSDLLQSVRGDEKYDTICV